LKPFTYPATRKNLTHAIPLDRKYLPDYDYLKKNFPKTKNKCVNAHGLIHSRENGKCTKCLKDIDSSDGIWNCEKINSPTCTRGVCTNCINKHKTDRIKQADNHIQEQDEEDASEWSSAKSDAELTVMKKVNKVTYKE